MLHICSILQLLLQEDEGITNVYTLRNLILQVLWIDSIGMYLHYSTVLSNYCD